MGVEVARRGGHLVRAAAGYALQPEAAKGPLSYKYSWKGALIRRLLLLLA